jgi:hypothetical protein
MRELSVQVRFTTQGREGVVQLATLVDTAPPLTTSTNSAL